MNSLSSYNENQYSYLQGSLMSLPDEEDQKTAASDPSMPQQRQESSPEQYSSTPSFPLTEQMKTSNLDDTQSANIDFQTSTISNTEDTIIQNWPQLSGVTYTNDQRYPTVSQSDSVNDVTTSFGIHQTQEQVVNDYNVNQTPPEEISSTMDYETLIRTKQLYFDPNPETIRKPQMIAPIIYKQNIVIRFLKPPAVPQGPLIIREIRPPQPPPPPPLVIRQRAPPPLSPPPIILREKPPQIPKTMTAQYLTKTLPPIPPPPRSVIIEKLPPLPARPRDVIIERWVPYESFMQKRKVVVQRAEEPKAYPPPRNIIIEYEKVEARVIRQVERLGVTPEDPENYAARYGNTLLDTEDLLAQVKQLGIVEDLSVPRLNDHGYADQITLNPLEQKFSYENSFSQQQFDQRSPRGSVADKYAMDQVMYSDTNMNTYAPTYENLVHGSALSLNFDELNEQSSVAESIDEDISTQLAQYGLTTESIPY